MKDKTRSGTQRPTDSKEGTTSALWILTTTASTRLNLANRMGVVFAFVFLNSYSKEANNCEKKANTIVFIDKGLRHIEQGVGKRRH